MTTPLVTAMVSTWCGERYLAGCLDDLLAQTLQARLEIVVVDACSPQREAELVRSYQVRHPNLHYVRTPSREDTSAAFNRATALARGVYLTTANVDDRHHPEFLATMVGVLEQVPFGLAYADSAISRSDNETFAETAATERFAWPHYTPATALSCCLFGAQPVWRRSLHQRAGEWSSAGGFANDQDMFLRLARVGGAVHVDAVLGLFLQRADSHTGANRDRALTDALGVFRQQRRAWSLEEIVPGATATGPLGEAAAWFELGNLAALGPYTDAELALDCYRRAVALPLGPEADAVQQAFAVNSGLVLLAAGASAAAERALRWVRDPAQQAAVARCRERAAAGERLVLPALPFVELAHPVVQRSRQAAGVRLDAAGRLQWSERCEQRPWDVFAGPNGVPWQRELVAVHG